MLTTKSKCVQCGSVGLDDELGEYETAIIDPSAPRGEPAHAFVGEVRQLRCRKCGEAYTDIAEIERVELAAARALAESGEVSGSSFRFMRHALGYTAAKLAELFGTRAETLSHWERGHRDVDRYAWATLAAMVTDRLEGRTDTIDRLGVMRAPRPLAKAVRLHRDERGESANR
jgi:DNA-binding transcriptional regulator YiaG